MFLKRISKKANLLTHIKSAVGAGSLLYSSHANERMRARSIIKPEVEFILLNGHHEARKDHFNTNFNSWDYSIRGKTIDGRSLRIIVAFEEQKPLIVTTIDLDFED